jgi:hypothetical protein
VRKLFRMPEASSVVKQLELDLTEMEGAAA